jgi:TonB family protein
MRSKREISDLKTRLVLAAIVVVVMIVLAGSKGSLVQGAAKGPAPGDRQLITRVNPDYPDAGKGLNLGGMVRVEALVAPDGSVRATKLLDGDSVLGQSAISAIRQWKYAPATADETLTVKIDFDSRGNGRQEQ